MRYQFYVLLISVLFAWPATNSFAQTGAGFFSRDEIPVASPRTVDAYYDPFTGDVLASVGEDVLLLHFGPSSTITDAGDRAILETSFSAIDRDSVREDAISALFFDESPNGLGWIDLNLSGLPSGVFDLGQVYDALPLPEPVALNSPLLTIDSSDPRDLLTILAERSPEEQLAFEVAAQQYYQTLQTGFSLAFQTAGNPGELATIRFLRPELAIASRPELAIAIPEPCSAILIPLAGAGLSLRRRRA